MPLTPGWPNDIAYLDAIQTPWACFTNQQLKAARIYKNDTGIPLAATGRSAIVFHADVGTADKALRCFTREARGQQLRYQALHAHLAGFIPSYMVDFTYRDREIRVAGELYPVVEMDWSKGEPLHLWVEQHLQDPGHLERLAGIWREVVEDLQDRRMAHGDLSSDNCLVTGRTLTLIDYDGCFIPELARSDPGEAGNPNFQHPGRMGYYGLNMDAFPALVIYLSLLALAVDHSLWEEFHNGRNLIFTAEDYVSPGETPLWRALARTSDRQLAPLLAALAEMCEAPIDELPPLSQVASDSSVPLWWRTWRTVPKTVMRVQGHKGQGSRRWTPTVPASILRRPWRLAALLAACAAAILIILGIWLTGGGSARSVNSVAFSPDGTTFAAVDAGGDIYLSNIAAGNPIATLPDPSQQAVTAVAFSPDGTTFAAANAGGDIYLWNIPATNPIATLPDPDKQAVNSVAFSPDGTTLAAADAGGGTYLWNIAAKEPIAVAPEPGKQAVTAVAFSPDGKTLATADASGGTYLWNIAARNLIASLPDPKKQAVTAVAFSPDGKTLATADAGSATYLWNNPAKPQSSS